MSGAPSAIVLTGVGLCTPLGPGAAASWDALLDGRSGVGPRGEGARVAADAQAVACCPRAEHPPRLRVPKFRKFAGRAASCALHAVQEAVTHAGYAQGLVDPLRVAVHGATGQTGLDVEEFLPALSAAWEADPDRDYAGVGRPAARLVDPHFSLRTLSNAAVALVAAEVGARGPSSNYVQGETAGAHALRAAWYDLREHRADVAVVFACDSLPHTSTWLAYERMGLLSRRPARATPSPFDRNRDGIVLGEGGAAMVLERASSARARGVTPLAEVVGVHVASPRPGALWHTGAEALPIALSRAWPSGTERRVASLHDGAFLVARGLGTVDHDEAELVALAQGPPATWRVTALKGATGYLGAATTIVEGVLAACALRAGVVPPVARLVTPDPACGAIRVAREPVALAAERWALVSSAGWAGDWAVIALRGGDGPSDDE